MNLGHLAIFNAVAVEGSVTRGAQRLLVSQPAVSKQLKQLERQLKTRLLEREKRGVRLTPAGAVLADYARRIFRLSEQAVTALSDLSALRSGTFAAAATPTLGAYLLPDVLIHFRRRFPGIEVGVEIGSVRSIGDLLRDASVDLAITDTPLTTSGTESSAFANEALVPIIARHHPLARKRRVDLQTLAQLPFIVRETGAAVRSFAESALAERGAAIRPVIALASTEAIKRAVVGGLGVAIVPRISIRNELAAGSLAVVRVPDLTLQRPIYISRPVGHRDSKATIAFLCLLKHGLRGTLPTLPPATPAPW